MALKHPRRLLLALAVAALIAISAVRFGAASEHEGFPETPKVDDILGRGGLNTEADSLAREEEAIKLDGINVAQFKELREKAEKHAFQAEVNRMMKLIINSLYRNKDIFLRELISNASDALDKIRLLSLTEKSSLDATDEMNIRIKADKDNHLLHIIDTGVGMTKQDLMNNLGTIAKSGTAEFISKITDTETKSDDAGDLIGQFGVGFYSAFLVADTVIVTTKHNDDKQYIWESDASSFTIAEDPRGPTLKRGTQITLKLKEEAWDFLEQDTLRNLVKKYSQFINFPIYLYSSKTEMVDEVLEEDEEKVKPEKTEDETETDVEEEKEEAKPKTKQVEKTTWDWEFLNDAKPIWIRKPAEIEDSEYDDFYKSLTKEKDGPLTRTHFIAEGEVSFKALLYVPNGLPNEAFNSYGKKTDNIKLYVRRVFITDDFQDMMPNYLSFIRGIVDSDDLPLNVSRENLQQHKLLKIIKKKLVRKTLDMMKKLEGEDIEKFWKEYGTHIKLGVIEDTANRSRLSKLLRFHSSAVEKPTSLAEYVARMKEKQQHIYYLAGASLKEIKESPFVERLLDKGYEVLYLPDPVDEYCVSALPEFDGKKFQNAAREGFKIEDDTSSEAAKEYRNAQKEKFEPLLKWLSDDALNAWISKAELSERLRNSPCALVASAWGWTGNMERLAVANAHQKADDSMRDYHMNQKKVLEVNPRHPLIKDLLKRVSDDPKDETAIEMAKMMFRTATLRSGYMLQDTFDFADTIEKMMRVNMGISLDEEVEAEPEFSADEPKEEVKEDEEEISGDDEDHAHTEL
ncbi:unnamed protein product [Notodromas monacha]|uniref:Heat shock protein 83 n=1 Tax=Notodromas monacha TaxID=399045 RepID=A0A7R9BXL3_9CRUS|nr:unnamed protein product [Notodromas monacha]CAG0922673.1 unnamed protein product [Notodromas monacha]